MRAQKVSEKTEVFLSFLHRIIPVAVTNRKQLTCIPATSPVLPRRQTTRTGKDSIRLSGSSPSHRQYNPIILCRTQKRRRKKPRNQIRPKKRNDKIHRMVCLSARFFFVVTWGFLVSSPPSPGILHAWCGYQHRLLSSRHP